MQRTIAMVTADGLPTAQINGVVWSQVMAGNTVFAGGEFTSVRPAGAPLGTNESARSNLMSFDLVTGVATAFAPTFNGPVKVVALSADQKTLYVGGQFTAVNGVNRYRFAAFTVSTGALLASPAPVVNSTVSAIAVIGQTIYLGGIFNQVGTASRVRLAAVNASTGAVLGWNPGADGTVRALVPTPDRTGIVAGGSFSKLGSTPALGMGSLDPASGAVKQWKANTVVKNYGANAAILTLSADSDTVYAGGYSYGGGNFEGIVAADPDTGTVKWLQDCHGDTYGIAPIGNTVYSAGHAHFCGNIGGFPDTNPRKAWYRALAVTKQVTGTVNKNAQSGTNYGNFEGQPAPSLFNWFPELQSGTFTGLDQGAWSIVGNRQYLVLAGEFTKINNKPQQGLVRMALPELAPNDQGPREYDATTAPTATVAAARSIAVRWKANWDRDDQVLTYEVLRNNVVIRTLRSTSQFWNRPTLTYVDQYGTPGTNYTYKIRASDPSGKTVTSPSTEVQYPSDTSYAQLVRADGASHQWRLGSAAGGSQDPDAVADLALSASPGVTFGAAGAFASDVDTAAGFDGTAQAIARTSPTQIAAGPFSLEFWFKTSSTAGGALAGTGAGNQSGPSAEGDRQVYLDAAGRIRFAVHAPGGASISTATSGSSFVDGEWHQVVAVQSAGVISLFVDGARMAVATVPAKNITSPGSLILGGTTASDLPTAPTATFAGTLDDVSVFDNALTPRQVREHFVTGQPRYGIVNPSEPRR